MGLSNLFGFKRRGVFNILGSNQIGLSNGFFRIGNKTFRVENRKTPRYLTGLGITSISLSPFVDDNQSLRLKENGPFHFIEIKTEGYHTDWGDTTIFSQAIFVNNALPIVNQFIHLVEQQGAIINRGGLRNTISVDPQSLIQPLPAVA